MKKTVSQERLSSGVRNLDELLYGGFPRGSVTVLGGVPGSGKTTLSMQCSFAAAKNGETVLIFQTLSEPVPKTIRNMAAFGFFDAGLIDKKVFFYDLGEIMRNKGLEKACSMVIEQIKRVRPAVVVIDSFRVFEDLAGSSEELRKFTYEVAVHLMAWECTALLIGEYVMKDLQSNPLSSIVDGIVMVTAHEESGEHQRFVQIIKMRGTNHDRNPHPASIGESGLEVYAPFPPSDAESTSILASGEGERMSLGISGIDSLMGEGIPAGSNVLVSGPAGTGKTLFLLEAIYRGAKNFDEACIFFSFTESPERLMAAAHAMGWDLEKEIKRGLVKIVYVPQSDILVEANLLMIHETIAAMKAKRIALDSLSVFFHKIKGAVKTREMLGKLLTIVRNANGVGLFSNGVRIGSKHVSRFGVEETMMDGILFLSTREEANNRELCLEVYKMRNTEHTKAKRGMAIRKGGISVFE